MIYKIKIKTSNKIFLVNGRTVRSPFECFVNHDNLSLIKSRIKFYGMNQKEYDIELVNDNKDKEYSSINTNDMSYSKKTNDDKIKESISDQKPIKDNDKVDVNNIKQKSIREEIKVHQPQIVQPKPKLTKNIKKEKITDFSNQEEQNKNINDDIEVKIEELTIKSSSLLDRFLNDNIEI